MTKRERLIKNLTATITTLMGILRLLITIVGILSGFVLISTGLLIVGLFSKLKELVMGLSSMLFSMKSSPKRL